MTFAEAIKSCYKKYATVSGRASRSEFWWFQLFLQIPYILSVVYISAVASSNVEAESLGNVYGGVIFLTWGLGNFLPALSVSVRRLHDLNVSGWWLLIGLVPLVGGIYLLIKFCRKGDVGPNKFGRQIDGAFSDSITQTGTEPFNRDITEQYIHRGQGDFFLLCTSGQYKGARFPLPTSGGAIAIGTDPSRCQIVIDKKSHPEIFPVHSLVSDEGAGISNRFGGRIYHMLRAVGGPIKIREVNFDLERRHDEKPFDWRVIYPGSSDGVFSDGRYVTEIDFGAGLLFYYYCTSNHDFIYSILK